GELVLAQACEQVRRWQDRDADGTPLTVHVNVSPVELERPEFPDVVAEQLAGNGLDPGQLVVEVTESVVMDDSRAMRSGLAPLRLRRRAGPPHRASLRRDPRAPAHARRLSAGSDDRPARSTGTPRWSMRALPHLRTRATRRSQQ